MNPVALVNPADFALSSLAMAVRSLYGVAGDLNEFIDKHIEELKASPDQAVERTGRVLEGAKKGLMLGYVSPAVLIGVGQLLLGNPLVAVGGAAVTLVSPVATTCAAIGAIWFGWRALKDSEQQAMLEELSRGFSLAKEVIQQVIEFALGLLRSTFASKEFAALKDFLVKSAAGVGRSLYAITGQTKDLLFSSGDDLDVNHLPPSGELLQVLKAMDRDAELEPLLVNVMKLDPRKVQGMVREGLERRAVAELGAAASYSLPGARVPAYDDMVRIVARQVKLPSRAELRTEDLERAILFKVVEQSLDRLSEEKKLALTRDVERALRERGINRQVGFSEIVGFVKFTGMDVGGTVGSLAMAAPGLTGTIGLNALQYVVLKGIIMTSGYMAAGGALLGFGMGGALITVAGAAGPIGAALGVIYTAYSLSGPAYRKLIPAICMIAAKRVELANANAVVEEEGA